MKALRLLALASCVAPAAFASNIVLQDDFSGSIVDSSKWTVIKPLASSSVTQSGGGLTTVSRGTLATAISISAPCTVAGSFTSNSFNELFTVTLRSDLSQTPNFQARQGLSVTFGDTNNVLDIATTDGSGVFTSLASVPYSFTTGAAYAFEINDDGLNVTVAINGSPVASASSSLVLGDRIAFYSREWSGTSSTLDYVTIASASAVPEPSTYAAFAGLAVLGLAAARRRRAA